MKRKIKTKFKALIPNDFRDFLSIISFIGFLAIFLYFTLGKIWLNDNLTALFLVFGGAGFLIIGKVVHIKKWAKDGIQENEISLLASIIFGLSSMVIGMMMLFNLNISENLYGYIGILALVPAIYIFIDYLAKNKS